MDKTRASTYNVLDLDSLPQTSLQRQRAKVVPPLPRAFRDLKAGVEPVFEEGSEETRPQVCPQFGSLLPLTLRRLVPGNDIAAGEHPGSAAASSVADPGSFPGGVETASNVSTAPSFPGASASGSGAAQTLRPRRSIFEDVEGLLGGSNCGRRLTSRSRLGGKRVGVVFASERRDAPSPPANLIAGLYAYLEEAAPGSMIVGFMHGPPGFLEGWGNELRLEEIAFTLNQGTWSPLGYGTCRDGTFCPSARKAEAERAIAVCKQEKLDGLVVIGGRRDLSWAAGLAVNFAEMGCDLPIVGVPHNKNLHLYVPHYMPLTLGFDTAQRHTSEIGGNISIDALSSDKYWHFLRCGEDALTVEVALQIRATFSVATGGLTEAGTASETPSGEGQIRLMDAVKQLQEVIEQRRSIGHRAGVVLLSRSLIEALREMDTLKDGILQITREEQQKNSTRSPGEKAKPPSMTDIEKRIEDQDARELFKRLPRAVQMSLVQRRDSDGRPLLPVDLEPERILGRFVQQEVKSKMTHADDKDNKFTDKFAPRFHALELMSSSPLPTPLDCALGYALGHMAAALVSKGKSFYVASCANLHKPVEDWEPCAVPFSWLYPTTTAAKAGGDAPEDPMAQEIPRNPVQSRNIRQVYKHFNSVWVRSNSFKSPGPLQFTNGGDVGPLHERPFTLLAEYMSLEELKQLIMPVWRLPPPLVIKQDPFIIRDTRLFENLSELEKRQRSYTPALPGFLRGHVHLKEQPVIPQVDTCMDSLIGAFPTLLEHRSAVTLVSQRELRQPKRGHRSENDMSVYASWPRLGSPTQSELNRPFRVGIIFASHQAPGFHNIVAGLFDQLEGSPQPVEVIGFLGGFTGLINNQSVEIDQEMVDQYRNLGGQDMLCQFSQPSTLEAHIPAAVETIKELQLNGFVVAGHLPSLMDASFIAEACAAERLPTRVVAVPIATDSNIPFVQQAIGYDTVCRTQSNFIGNLGSLTQATGDCWVFIRLNGESRSHQAVQCTIETHVSTVLLSGNQIRGQSLTGIVQRLCDLIMTRHENGFDHGTVLIPVGFMMDVTDLRVLMSEIIEIMHNNTYDTGWDAIHDIAAKLKESSAAIFSQFPRDVQYEICFGGRERGTPMVEVENISSDRLMLRFVEIELKRRRQLGLIEEDFFNGITYPMVHQARSALPTRFDCDLSYTLGWAAGLMVTLGKSGQLVHASNLEKSVDEWIIHGLPLTSLLCAKLDEETHDAMVKATVLQVLKERGVDPPLKDLPPEDQRLILYQGPVQFPKEGSQAEHRTTWLMEAFLKQDPQQELEEISRQCATLHTAVAEAKFESTLLTVNSLLTNALSVLDSYNQLSEASSSRKQSLADVPIEPKQGWWRVDGRPKLFRRSSRSGMEMGLGPRSILLPVDERGQKSDTPSGASSGLKEFVPPARGAPS
eukprot:TRINITY_DN17951_c0_g2_i5.p1 TRINITY_DN17951_c0_g2~~TRINITY_DN17951_c0_g2_i5.p1  ORF type:complete len:1420 (-),score=249.07 TRINITY_DN17951_c0_g2_i5:49-4308(-)